MGREEVVLFLEENPDAGYDSAMLARELGLSKSTVVENLRRMRKTGEVRCLMYRKDGKPPTYIYASAKKKISF